MNKRIRMRLCVIAVTASALSVGAGLPVSAATTSSGTASGCDASAQDAGTCLGFTMYGGENPYEAAVAGALLGGRQQQAKTFVSSLQVTLPATVRSDIQQAVSAATSTDSAAGAGAALSEQNAAIADASTLAVSPAVAAASVPAQAANGETAAIGYFYWLLHNSYHVPLYYGNCNTQGCKTGGSWDATQTANVFYSATSGMQYSGEIYHQSGMSATLSGVEVRLFRDVTGGPDTNEVTLSCPTSGSSWTCATSTKRGNVVGHWYYLRLDMTTHPSGYPSSTFQMQTRRYKDISQPSDWEFLSYQYYGD